MEDFMHSFKGSDFFAPLFKRWLIHCYNTADLLITPTDYSKQLLSGYGLKPPIYSLSNGIDSDFFAPDPEAGKRFREKYQIAPDQKVIISVGHYIARKGILDFAELAKRMPEYRFIWFGYTNLNLIPKEIRRVIENPPKNLLFGGYICREELRDAYCGSDAFLFLTHEETEGIVLLEALATGVPVIVRDIPIYKTFLTDGFDVYKGSTLDQFEALVRGAAEKNLPGIETVGENGRKTACTRDMHAVATRLEELYQLVSGGQN
jgi:1,2-diacylglycerol-3-alpha-glucose alpha-1,2-glucosyltransferase